MVVTNTDGLKGTLTGGYTYTQAANQPPQVQATASVTTGVAPLVVNFTANASDPDGTIAGYSWNFGDGQTASIASPSHTYQTNGTFTARVTVTDNAGATATASVVVTVSSSPRPVVQMVKPNAAEVLIINSSYTISWTVVGTNISSQTIQLSLDGGITWQDVVTDLSGGKRSYSWIVPNLPTKTGRIRVMAYSGGMYGEGMSANNFTIARKAKAKQKPLGKH